VLVAVHPGLAIYSAVKAHPLPFDALLFTLVLLQLFRVRERPSPTRAVTLGLIIGLGTLSRSTMLILPSIGALWLVSVSPAGQRRLMIRHLATAAVVAVAVIMPWSIRDSLVHDRPLLTLISTHGEDFWRGNNPMATGHSYIRRNVAVISALPPAERADLERQPDELAQSEWFTRKARAFIRKFFHFWWFAPQTGVLYPPAWRTHYMAYYVAVLLLAVAGVARLRAFGPLSVSKAILVVLFLLGLSLVQSVYYVETRHRWGIEAMLLALSGGGVAAVMQRFRRDTP
jgi:4-amino-4-deoxy-L-arabinose transferase-like glycosyltransferase